MSLSAAQLGGITLGLISYRAPVRITTQALETGYQVNLPLAGSLHSSFGGERTVATPTRAAVYGVDRPTMVEGWHEPHQVLAMKIDRETLEHQLALLLGTRPRGPIAFSHGWELTGGPARQWLRILSALTDHIGSPDALTRNPMVALPMTQALLTGLLLSAAHNYRTALDETPAAAPAPAVKRAVDFIESYPHLALSAADIARAADVPLRTLQEGFRRHLSTTPMRHLRRTRLDRVRRELLTGTPSDVTSVALRWGFAHLGRFTQYYRSVYGELPSQTLASARSS